MWAWDMGWLHMIMETLLANAGMKHKGRADSISSSGEYHISLIFIPRIKVIIGCNLIHLLLFHICVWCGNRVVPDVPGQHMFQYVHQHVLKHLILSLIINVFHFLLSNCTLCCEITVSSLCKLVYKSDYIICAYGKLACYN